MLDRDCTNSAVLVALQLNAERSSLEASKNTRQTQLDLRTNLDGLHERVNTAASSHQPRNMREDMLTFRFPPPEDRHALDIFISKPHINSPSECSSPTSDTTLLDDDLDVRPTSQSTGPQFMHGYIVESNTPANRSQYTSCHQVQERAAIPIQKRSARHRCHESSSPAFDTISTQQQLRTARLSATVGVLTAEEREMEYQHRHIFLGTASLDEFLGLLEISSSHRVTQRAVVRAFVQLASVEQLYARQYSTKLDKWGLVARTTPDYKDLASVDYVLQSRVKLGSITLRQLLDMVPFDQDNAVAVTKVIDAFSAASHLDVKTNMDITNKGRALRSWIVSQNMNAYCC
jgi:hypothetical protein